MQAVREAEQNKDFQKLGRPYTPSTAVHGRDTPCRSSVERTLHAASCREYTRLGSDTPCRRRRTQYRHCDYPTGKRRKEKIRKWIRTKIIVVEDNIVYWPVCLQPAGAGRIPHRTGIPPIDSKETAATSNRKRHHSFRLASGPKEMVSTCCVGMRKEGMMQPFIIMTDYAEVAYGG